MNLQLQALFETELFFSSSRLSKNHAIKIHRFDVWLVVKIGSFKGLILL